jgi:hypothetical protein
MGNIEELSGDSDAFIHLDGQPVSRRASPHRNTPSDTTFKQPLLEVDHAQGPELPPLLSARLQSKNEIVDSKESTPLFMKDAGLLDWEGTDD